MEQLALKFLFVRYYYKNIFNCKATLYIFFDKYLLYDWYVFILVSYLNNINTPQINIIVFAKMFVSPYVLILQIATYFLTGGFSELKKYKLYGIKV